KSHPQYYILVKEAKILQQCQHSSSPIIYDILEFDTQTYIVEEYIEAENLKQYIARQRSLSASVLLEISKQLCDILIFLHNPARQILYLDLKPENILYSDCKVKLIDFGSAIYQNMQNEKMFIFGTPGYFAPEMKAMGKLSEKTDIYCMGKCMEYMLFYVSKVPKGYRNIVDRCLRKAGKEYDSAEQIHRDLEKISRRKAKEKAKEIWYAVAGVLSEHDSSMAALQLAMYLRDRYKKPVLYLDCTQESLMERLELSEKNLANMGRQNNFVLEQNGITVAKRVAPQEISGWRGRGYAYVVVCFGKNNPLIAVCPFKLCLCTGAVTEFSLKEWKTMLLPLSKRQAVAVALTGGDKVLAKKEFGRVCHIAELPGYVRPFGESRPFRRQIKHLLDGK
ncbi:MAG: protein kinase, partial [Lachnospiraceae bacterium]|nr:protein kinase [Lachnospiraceae bacterium]